MLERPLFPSLYPLLPLLLLALLSFKIFCVAGSKIEVTEAVLKEVTDKLSTEDRCSGEQSFQHNFGAPTEALSEQEHFLGTRMVEFNPTHEVLEGVDVVWQIPPNPKAILFHAHVRHGSPFTYWPSTPSVPQCTGTPEHKKCTKEALDRGFAVIVSKSITDEWETWPTSSPDIKKVVKILTEWRKKHGLEHLPLNAWGSSCGGSFVNTLALEIKLHSQVTMISHGNREAFNVAVKGAYPPTLFVPMIKDGSAYAPVKENVEILIAKGIPSAIVEAPPHKVTPHFLAEHIDELDEEQAAKLHALFIDDGIIAQDNSLIKLLRDHQVEPYLKKAGLVKESDTHSEQNGHLGEPAAGRAGGKGGDRGPMGKSSPLASGISNQLKVAEGQHTITARHNNEVFEWLEGKSWPKV